MVKDWNSCDQRVAEFPKALATAQPATRRPLLEKGGEDLKEAEALEMGTGIRREIPARVAVGELEGAEGGEKR